MASMRLSMSFLSALALALLIQSFLWHNTVVIDIRQWAKATAAMQEWNEHVFDEFTHGYPGTPLLMVAVTAYTLFPISPAAAYTGALITIIALATAGTIAVCRLLKPASNWHVVVLLLLSFNSLLPTATPPTAAVGPAIVLLTFYALYIASLSSHTKKHLVIWGVLLGITAALRADFGIAFGVPLLLYLSWEKGWRFFPATVIASICSFIIFNPYMWFAPQEHILALWNKFFYHAFIYSEARVFTWQSVLQYSAFGIIGLLYTITGLIVPQIKLPKKSFFVVMIFLTCILAGVFATAKHQAIWYILPIVMFWEITTSYILFSLTPSLLAPSNMRLSIPFSRLAETTVSIVLVGGAIALYVQHITLPTVINVLP